MYLLVIPLIFLCVYLLWVLYWVRAWKVDTKVPSYPGALPFIGHCHLLMKNSTNLWEQLKAISLEAGKCGGIIRIWLGPMPLYLVSDPDLAIKLANTCMQKHYFYKFAATWVGEGLVVSNGTTWLRHRKLLNPTFNQHILDGFLQVFNSQSKILVDRLATQAGKGPFNHCPYLVENSLETVWQTIFGFPASDNVMDQRFKDAVAKGFQLLVERFLRIWLHLDLLYKYSDLKREEDRTMAILKNMSSSVIQQKRDVFQKNIKEDKIQNGLKFKTFVELLLELGDEGSMTNQEISDEVDTMIVAAYDTTATSLFSILITLGSYPDVQRKVYEELDKVLGGRDIEKEDLNKLVYTEAVIKETLRLSPTVPIVGRDITEDVKIDDKYVIPKNCGIIFSIYGIHRSKVWGDDAHVFRPERWLEPETLPTSPAAYALFSFGRRACIGKTFAMAMKTVVAHLLQRYTIKADSEKLIMKYEIMLKPVSGYNISIEERNK